MSGTIETQDAPVFAYALASADLRYIEIGERDIYLRQEQGKGRIFRGEIAGCGPECYINLSEILLEYAMSCEGCSRAELATEMITHFGDYLGQVLVEAAAGETRELSSSDRLSYAMRSILKSMNVEFTEEKLPGSISYALLCWKKKKSARVATLNRSVASN